MQRHMMHPYMQNPYRQDEPENREEENMEDLPATEEEAPLPAEEPADEIPQAEPEAKIDEEALQNALKEERLRMAAEMDNFKKRLNREHQEQMRYASEKVLSDLLPALDNLDLALQYGSRHEACHDMMQGIEMTRKQLLEAVAKSGLVSVGNKGEQFNPEIHEAIGMESNPELEKGAVSQVMQRGYKLNDRLLRPAKVMVNN